MMMKGIPITHVNKSSTAKVRMNIKMDDINELQDLNYEEAKQYIGGVVFVSIIMIIGIIGNLHVLYVYKLLNILHISGFKNVFYISSKHSHDRIPFKSRADNILFVSTAIN
jgi:hypothetical protein